MRNCDGIFRPFKHDFTFLYENDAPLRKNFRGRSMTVFIDNGEPGTWADMIAHSPTLRVTEYSPFLKAGDDLPSVEFRKDGGRE